MLSANFFVAEATLFAASSPHLCAPRVVGCCAFALDNAPQGADNAQRADNAA
jgi:hypothetical protein